jgi:hypothetical protein
MQHVASMPEKYDVKWENDPTVLDIGSRKLE